MNILLQLFILLQTLSKITHVKLESCGGVNAKLGQFPYHAQIISIKTGKILCSGSILNGRWILTAGHCIHTNMKKSAKVLVGGIFIKKGHKYYILKGIRHNKFKRSPQMLNDIGLIKTVKKITFTKHIKSIPLSTSNIQTTTSATIIGFSRIVDFVPSTRLKHLTVKIISNKDCIKKSKSDKIYPEYICVRQRRENGACFGDPGAPLVLNGKLIGIASRPVQGSRHTNKTCALGYPYIFTRVFKYKNWIKSTMGS